MTLSLLPLSVPNQLVSLSRKVSPQNTPSVSEITSGGNEQRSHTDEDYAEERRSAIPVVHVIHAEVGIHFACTSTPQSNQS